MLGEAAVATVPEARAGEADGDGHMIVCGGGPLAHRLAVQLAALYERRVVVLVPSLTEDHGPRIAELARERPGSVRAVQAPRLDVAALELAGVGGAVALALTSGDDHANLQVALNARQLNPDLRLVVRVFNRRLGNRIEQALDRAVLARNPELTRAELEASTTVLSTSATAAPALVAAAVSGRSQAVQVDGRLLRATVRRAGEPPSGQELATVAAVGPLDEPGTGSSLLPAPERVGTERVGTEQVGTEQVGTDPVGAERVVLELLGDASTTARRRRLPGLPGLPFASLFSARLRWALAGLVALLALLAGATVAFTGQSPAHSAWLTVLDVLGIADPTDEGGRSGKVLQILTAVSGMLLMPLLIALVLEALGTFRTATALRRPPRGLADHVVLVGLGRLGSRVLEQLWDLDVPVVCVEADPAAVGVARARAFGVPVVIGDATQDGVLEAAKVGRAQALLALSSDDSTNFEVALAGRESVPRLRAVLRLFDDDFAENVYLTLRDSYPEAQTRSRSVAYLAAPAFASAMMGRQVIGALAVGREVLVIAAVEVARSPRLRGVTVADAHRPGLWRVLAVDLAPPEFRSPDLAQPRPGGPELLWSPPPGRVLVEGDRVVVAATARGLGLLGSRPDRPAREHHQGR
ncbi:NAD-binding protein [Kitasatospora sp. NPDC059795]|uniref:NAD-binding protein n=1 Tax=Kitasatospora sp. NPDC059795 TaxID=3346949 RepID=UPI003668292E